MKQETNKSFYRAFARGAHYAGLMLEEIMDIKPVIEANVPEHLKLEHSFFNVTATVEKIARRKKIKFEEALKLVAKRKSARLLAAAYKFKPKDIKVPKPRDNDDDIDNEAQLEPASEDKKILIAIPEALKDIVESMRVTVDITGERPPSSSNEKFAHGPLKDVISPARAHALIREFSQKNEDCPFAGLSGIADYYSIGTVRKRGRKTITASYLFNAVCAHMTAGKNPDLLSDPDFTIGGHSVLHINNAFATEGRISDLDQFIPEGASKPTTLQEFSSCLNLENMKHGIS